MPAHKRTKRGRKPIDPALPRQVVRHELPENERVCPHDGTALVEIDVETQPVINLLRDLLLASPLIYGDETMVQVLKKRANPRSPRAICVLR